MDAMQTMQATLDQFQHEMPEGAYLKLCACAKELHAVTKLYEVTYYEIYYDSDDGRMYHDKHVRLCMHHDRWDVHHLPTVPQSQNLPSSGSLRTLTLSGIKRHNSLFCAEDFR